MAAALALVGALVGTGALGLALALSLHAGFALRVGAEVAGRTHALLAGELDPAEALRLMGLARRLRRPVMLGLVGWFGLVGALLELSRRPLP
jgi:hypothetical protein